MIIQCSSCQTRYHYDESRFAGSAAKSINARSARRSSRSGTRPSDAGSPSPPAGVEPHRPEPRRVRARRTALTEAKKRAPREVPGGARARPCPATAPPRRTSSPPQAEHRADGGDKAAGPAGRAGAGATAAPLRCASGGQRLSLACIAGPDSGRIFEIDKPRVVIGRADADILVNDSGVLAQPRRDRGHRRPRLPRRPRLDERDLRLRQADHPLELENRSEFEVGSTTLMLIRSYSRESPSAG